MSNSCPRTCTIVLIYCAVLFAHVSLTVSARDSHLSAARRVRSGNSFSPVKFPYRNHPSLRHAILTDNMRSLLYELRRKKRMPHHGRSNKMWRTTVTSATEYRTTVPPPLINVNDIESFNCRQKHDCRILKENDDTIALDYVDNPISLVRRAAASESTLPTTAAKRTISSSETTQYSTSTQSTTDKHRGTRAAAAEFPIIITEIIELGAQSAEQITLQRRQVSEEPPTTCITISGSTESTTAAGAEAEVATTGVPSTEVGQQPPPAEAGATSPPAEGQTAPAETATEAPAAVLNETASAATEVPISAPPATEIPVTAAPATEGQAAPPSEAPVSPAAPPTPQVNDDYGGGKVVMTTPNLAAMATTAGALVGGQRPQETAPIDPGKLSQTLDEILESVESLADQKHTANEDFPCQVNGSWISEAGGVRLEISHKGNNALDVAISEVVGRTKKTPSQGFLSPNSWNITGLIPLEKKSMVILNAVNGNENQLATFIGECKTYSFAIQIIWGHWVLGQPGTKSEGIFTQRVFVDALERIRRKGNGTTTTATIATEAATTQIVKGAESVTSGSETENATTTENETTIESETTAGNDTTTESETAAGNDTTTSGAEETGGDTTSEGMSTRKRYSSLEKTSKKDGKVSTKKKRVKSSTEAVVVTDKSLATKRKNQIENFFADKRELPTPSYVTTRQSAYSIPAEIVPKLGLVQRNLNEILSVLNDYLTPTVVISPTTRRYLFLKPVTTPQASSSATIQTKQPLLVTTPIPLTTRVRYVGKLISETLPTQRKSMKPTPVPTRSSTSALQNILDKLDNLDKRLNKFINATETTMTTVSPLTTARKVKKRKRAS